MAQPAEGGFTRAANAQRRAEGAHGATGCSHTQAHANKPGGTADLERAHCCGLHPRKTPSCSLHHAPAMEMMPNSSGELLSVWGFMPLQEHRAVNPGRNRPTDPPRRRQSGWRSSDRRCCAQGQCPPAHPAASVTQARHIQQTSHTA